MDGFPDREVKRARDADSSVIFGGVSRQTEFFVDVYEMLVWMAEIAFPHITRATVVSSAMNKRLPLAMLLITQVFAGGFAQQPTPTPTPPPSTQERPQQAERDDVVRITTNLVQVDAVITDGKGRVVNDLKEDEVEIFENGHRQEITHFSYFVTESPEATREKQVEKADKNAPLPPPPPTRLRREEIRRTIALVVDDLGLSFESVYFVRRALKKFVDEQMQPGDLVAIIRTAGGLGALQQFTSDKRLLYAAIERVKFYMNGRGRFGIFTAMDSPAGESGGVDAAREDLDELREDVFAAGTLGAVNYVVRGMGELPGRKSIFLMSDGFGVGSFGDRSRNLRTMQKLRLLIDEAARASVVIYTMNATGLQTLNFTAADNYSALNPAAITRALNSRRTAALGNQDGLDVLAHQTGGLAIKNTNDLSGAIRRMMEDQKGYYLIGYRPESSTFNLKLGGRQFHHLSVKVKRPGKFNVRMRSGFLGVSDEEKTLPPTTVADQLAKALVSPFGATGVHVQLTSLFANDPQLGSIMRSILYVDPRDLTFTDEPNGGHKCVFDLVAITFGDNGVPVDEISRIYTAKLSSKEYERVQRQGLVYHVTVPIKKAGAYQLRMAFRDSVSARIGSASQFIEVPDIKKNRLALSGMVLRGGSLEAILKIATTTTSPGEGIEEGDAEASPAVRHFKRGMVLAYSYIIYNARLDKATGGPRLVTQIRLFRDGKETYTGQELPYDITGETDLKRLVSGGGIQLGAGMEPGDYVLQVIVTDLLADKKHRIATQWMDFQIVK